MTIAQIFDALSFYADYPEQVNGCIEKYAGHPAPLLRLKTTTETQTLTTPPIWEQLTQIATQAPDEEAPF